MFILKQDFSLPEVPQLAYATSPKEAAIKVRKVYLIKY